MDRFIEQGLGPYREYHLKRIDELVLDGIGATDVPPIINARHVYAQFLETVTDYQAEVRTRTETHLKEWLDLADMLKELDDQWRAENPETAKQFPAD